jgi:hypothetical protein
MNRFQLSTFLFVLMAVTILLGAPFSEAYVASSTSYRLQTDSINTGGILSTSTSYRAEDTLGESGVGTSSSASYAIKAGYQQMQTTYLAISAPGNITLSPAIITTGGGTGDGSGAWTITTDNPAGFTMNIRAGTNPALVSGGNSFANYTPAGANPDYTFSVGAATSEFAFTPEGSDIVQKYKDNGAACNIGAGDTASACWMPLVTTAETIVTRTTANHPAGGATTLRFRAQSGAANTQPVGSYSAAVTLTVLAQ